MRLLRTQDDERRHIARELHDSTGQALTVIGMKLDRLIKESTQASPDISKMPKRSRGSFSSLARTYAQLAYLLHPPLLDESGLSAALAWYVRGLAERSGLDLRLSVSENLERLPQNMELVIFRLDPGMPDQHPSSFRQQKRVDPDCPRLRRCQHPH